MSGIRSCHGFVHDRIALEAPTQKPAGGFGATVSASLDTVIRGTLGRLELSDCVWGVLLFLVLVSGLIAEAYQSKFSDFLVWGALVGLILCAGNRVVQNWRRPAGPVPAQAIMTLNGISLTAYADPKELVAIVRELQLGRETLKPAGVIEGENLSDDGNIRRYSDAECDAEAKRIAEEVAAQDRELLNNANRIVQEIIDLKHEAVTAQR